MRKPAVAGMFYPKEPDALEKLLRNFIEEEKSLNLSSAIVPHAGYIYSGAVAGSVYSVMPTVNTYVIIGPNHSYPDISVSNETWLTPLGEVNVNIDFVNRLNLTVNNQAHKIEHSIEVQIPFLQYRFDEFEIVPICMGLQGSDAIQLVFNALKNVKDTSFIVIASSDFTHYEPESVARDIDKNALDSIIKLNVPDFLKKARSSTICGVGPIAVAMEHAKLKGADHGEVLQYATSGDVSGDSMSVVGYAGLALI